MKEDVLLCGVGKVLRAVGAKREASAVAHLSGAMNDEVLVVVGKPKASVAVTVLAPL